MSLRTVPRYGVKVEQQLTDTLCRNQRGHPLLSVSMDLNHCPAVPVPAACACRSTQIHMTWDKNIVYKQIKYKTWHNEPNK